MPSKKFRVNMRRFHRWIGVIIGLQLAVWVISGAYFAWLSIDKIRGNDNNLSPTFAYPSPEELFPISGLRFPNGKKIKSVSLEATLRGPIYTVSTPEDEQFRFDAKGGVQLDMISVEALPEYINQQKASVEINSVTLLKEKVREFGGRYPVYSIALKDSMQGKLYVDPWSGKVLATRNMFWVVYDFLWMLHIMDYKEREDFNNALIRALSLLSAGVIISGYFLFAFGKAPRRSNTRT